MTPSRGIRVRRGTRVAWLSENDGKHFCQCGCGEAIKLRPDHFNTGIPAFKHGHNARIDPPKPRRERPAARPCECGCGSLASAGSRYLPGHNATGRKQSEVSRAKIRASKLGALNPHYGKPGFNRKNGTTTTRDGYVMRWAPSHPHAIGRGYVMDHRLVAETHLRATDASSPFLTEVDGEVYLRRELHVHHIDGDKANNAVENLEVLTAAEHTARHRAALNAARRAARS